MKTNATSLLFFLAKVAIALVLIAIICTKIDFAVLARHVNTASVGFLLLGTALLAVNVLLVGVRWWFLLRRLGVAMLPLGYAMASTYVSVFVGQAMPGPIGSDAVRGWLCYRRGVNLRVTITSLVTDRLLALLGLIVVAGAVWFRHFDAADQSLGRQVAILAVAVVAVGVLGFWLLPVITKALAGRWARFTPVHDLVSMFRFAALSRAGALGMALSCVVVALTVSAVLVFARGFGIALAPSIAYLIVPLAVLFSALPISIGGWGVREASLSYGLTLFGTPADDAALLGLALGIGLLLASLPGGIVMLAFGSELRPAFGRARVGLVE
jgi:uncharacterized membrane protein YbhN (UPF0104 family)